MELAGARCLVTGASSGIGRATAVRLIAAGAHVLALGRNRPALETPGGEPLVCDLLDRDAIARAVADAGRVDVLVNNAGMVDAEPAIDEPLERFKDVIAVNLVAPFALAQRAARAMLDGGEGGAIVNVASILGLRGVGQIPQAGYAASKGGVVNLTRELAAQWARKGIRVNAIAPGWFESEMTEDMFAEESGHKWVARRAPMGRHGREGELDGALLFLAGDASTYVTGQIVAVDGGWTAV
jgi:NAD(P)-dependent dehydrogenase (short-subunit alcohol dehydrogenase family)